MQSSNARNRAKERNLIVISGYYGFDNLGDEAILEELINELNGACDDSELVVLSHSPEQTSQTFGVRSISRWSLVGFCKVVKRAKLFISGGGSLFQETKNLNTVLFYGGQIVLARLLGASVLIYAQGLGPFRSALAKLITKIACSAASMVTVRDQLSKQTLDQWGLSALETADPVWCLEPTLSTASLKQPHGNGITVGLSLRPWPLFTTQTSELLADSLQQSLPRDSQLLLMPLQDHMDRPVLEKFAVDCDRIGLPTTLLESRLLERPSQWLSLIDKLDLLIGMRLHALIMALRMGKPVIGINYDQKVAQILQVFEQPALSLTPSSTLEADWSAVIKDSLQRMPELSERAQTISATLAVKSCKNFEILVKMLQT
jgi:polysaccharide pyruvyl transferase CsaB